MLPTSAHPGIVYAPQPAQHAGPLVPSNTQYYGGAGVAVGLRENDVCIVHGHVSSHDGLGHSRYDSDCEVLVRAVKAQLSFLAYIKFPLEFA